MAAVWSSAWTTARRGRAAPPKQEKSVRRTVSWAKRGKEQFESLLKGKKMGRGSPAGCLRHPGRRGAGFTQGVAPKRCWRSASTALGLAAGRWMGRGPADRHPGVHPQLVPPQFPMHALGVGHPRMCWRVGTSAMACSGSAMPTRDARPPAVRVHLPGWRPRRRPERDWIGLPLINARGKHIKGPTSRFRMAVPA